VQRGEGAIAGLRREKSLEVLLQVLRKRREREKQIVEREGRFGLAEVSKEVKPKISPDRTSRKLKEVKGIT